MCGRVGKRRHQMLAFVFLVMMTAMHGLASIALSNQLHITNTMLPIMEAANLGQEYLEKPLWKRSLRDLADLANLIPAGSDGRLAAYQMQTIPVELDYLRLYLYQRESQLLTVSDQTLAFFRNLYVVPDYVQDYDLNLQYLRWQQAGARLDVTLYSEPVMEAWLLLDGWNTLAYEEYTMAGVGTRTPQGTKVVAQQLQYSSQNEAFRTRSFSGGGVSVGLAATLWLAPQLTIQTVLTNMLGWSTLRSLYYEDLQVGTGQFRTDASNRVQRLPSGTGRWSYLDRTIFLTPVWSVQLDYQPGPHRLMITLADDQISAEVWRRIGSNYSIVVSGYWPDAAFEIGLDGVSWSVAVTSDQLDYTKAHTLGIRYRLRFYF